jgi:hypothetical protein
MPPNTVYVGRPTKWGNPYRIGQDVGMMFAMTRQETVNAYRGWLLSTSDRSTVNLSMLHELRDQNLACWCPLDQPCHADVLLEIANAD